MLSNEAFDVGSLEQIETYIQSNVKTINYFVVPSNLFECALDVTLNLFSAWKKEDLELEQCKDGITNKLIKCTNRPLNFSILIRTYGNKSEILIDRKQEIYNIVALSGLGLSPPLYGRFDNGIVYGFINGKVLSVADLSDPYKSSLIAKNLAIWHGTNIAGEKMPNLFITLKKWLKEVKSYNNDEKFLRNFSIEKLNQELIILEQELVKVNSPVTFCHNDLLYGNIIYDESEEKVSFIDYEYACYSYRGFDIGNHFCEFAGFDCDYNLYPSKKFQRQWLRHYLNKLNPAHDATEEEISTLYREVNKFALASHFYWGLWGLIQAQLSDIDFNYMEYAVLRFTEFYKRKDEFLSL
ncbi:hypothetical protein RclHR1_04350015 [Rhizophagus clarus]|uniref:ethanolamine kinase n=1 Tax=Rhizophagus clarus TaxID=94130 RepID=A0A2Z6SB75_9GLOM|nr:hypothetical protein RclHR1_04350015 [Rhizophagus clarus]GES87121.1 ethanolamine kinase [Rhizophagus clarus]